MENYDRITLQAFKISDLKTIIVANNIPLSEKDGKRGYINDILKYQGTYDEEMQKIKDTRDAKNERIESLLYDRSERSLKKLKMDELMNMVYKFRVSGDEIQRIQKLKGRTKRGALIDLLVQDPNKEAVIMAFEQETSKYQKYYVYPGYWFKSDYEWINTINVGLSNVRCILCYKTSGTFLKQFNVCKDCHLILQTEFCRRFCLFYWLTIDIISIKDIRSYIWNMLKHII